jgi:hypothetical protein
VIRRLFRWARSRPTHVGASLGYAWRWYRTPPAERMPFQLRVWRMPVCWLRGHRFGGDRGGLLLAQWRAYGCQRCGEELMGRHNWNDLATRPADSEDGDFDQWED